MNFPPSPTLIYGLNAFAFSRDHRLVGVKWDWESEMDYGIVLEFVDMNAERTTWRFLSFALSGGGRFIIDRAEEPLAAHREPAFGEAPQMADRAHLEAACAALQRCCADRPLLVAAEHTIAQQGATFIEASVLLCFEADLRITFGLQPKWPNFCTIQA